MRNNTEIPRRREAGFTLMEVLVAFTIFALSFAAIMQIFSGGLRNATVADRALIALGHAESLLARAGTEQPLVEGVRSGGLPDGMTWRETVARYSDATTPAVPPAGLQPYSVTVTVSWDDRDVTLTTLRLGGTT
ncbi:type II secretion system protein [Pelagibius sp. CAU 1746]|uniref:type IV pilus modification PilV family protein n=1 Tax=Pelagibius sp. CAU 1746 TaxID=3140370 RepID=UPI00325AB859